MVLDRNPENYFAEVEQIAFAPSHMVPGIEPSPDKMLQVTDCMCACVIFLLSGISCPLFCLACMSLYQCHSVVHSKYCALSIRMLLVENCLRYH